ncbi:MAG: glycosyltransferase family 9 protein [bacterium]
MNKKILVVRLGAIGDVVHTTIINQSIKEKYPESQIHFLTSDFIAPLLENDPNLAKVYRFDNNKKDDFFYLCKLGLIFRREKFDVIINLSNSFRNQFMIFVANPKKIANRNRHRIHAVDAFFNSAKDVFEDIEKPENLKLFLSDKTKDLIEEKTKKFPRPFFVINPGGENDNLRQGRIWSLKNWIDLSNRLIEKHGGTVFIVGSKGEREYHKELLKINSSVLFSGELRLDESAALVAAADLFISGDSGPLHMASALGVKTLGLMGSTTAESCGPYGVKGYAINSIFKCPTGCDKVCQQSQESIYKPCMQSITPEIVFDFIENNL